jgi:hypothetical protein
LRSLSSATISRLSGARQSFADLGFADWYRALPIGSCRQGWLAAGRHGILGAGGDEVGSVGKLVGVAGISTVIGGLSVLSETVMAFARAGNASQRVFRFCRCWARC